VSVLDVVDELINLVNFKLNDNTRLPNHSQLSNVQVFEHPLHSHLSTHFFFKAADLLYLLNILKT
jgi:hypothetical protein